jgi:hypothetical protein
MFNERMNETLTMLDLPQSGSWEKTLLIKRLLVFSLQSQSVFLQKPCKKKGYTARVYLFSGRQHVRRTHQKLCFHLHFHCKKDIDRSELVVSEKNLLHSGKYCRGLQLIHSHLGFKRCHHLLLRKTTARIRIVAVEKLAALMLKLIPAIETSRYQVFECTFVLNGSYSL